MNFVLNSAYKVLDLTIDVAAWAVAKVYGLSGDKWEGWK